MGTQASQITMELNKPEDMVLPLVLTHETCARCGGLMVAEFCLDMLDDTGKLSFLARRCVQCGEVVDPIILKNRQHPTVYTSSKSRKILAHRRMDKQFSTGKE